MDDLTDLYLEDTLQYGLVVIGGEDAEFHRITQSGKHIDSKLIEKFSVLRDKRQKKGGQSAHRFQMTRLGQINDYEKKICERMNKLFGDKKILGIIIVGIGEIKDRIKGHNDLIVDINNKIKAVLAVSKLDMNEILPMIKPYIANSKLKDELKIVDNFMDIMRKNSDLVIYGLKEIETSLEESLIHTLLIHEDCERKDELIAMVKNKDKCKINEVNDSRIRDFGGIVGILYYKKTDTN